MNPRRTTGLIAGLALALGLLGVVRMYHMSRVTDMREAATLVAHTYEVQTQLNRVLSSLEGVETGARGFVITGDPVFLEPFERGRLRVEGELATLCQLIRNDVQHQGDCDTLAPLITNRVALSEANVKLRRTRGFDAAREVVATGEGRGLMEQIRQVIARIDTMEQSLLGQHAMAATREASVSDWLAMAVEAIGVILFVTMFALLVRETRMRQQMQLQLDRFFRLSLDMICIAGMDGYLKRVSPGFTQTLGYTTNELLARPYLDLVHPDDRPAAVAELGKLGHGVPTIDLEIRVRCQDGSFRWLSWKVQPIVEEGRLYATARDITERRAAENELRRSRAVFESLFESLPGLFLVLTPDLKIVAASDAYLTATMTTREGLLGRDLFEAFPDNPDDPTATGTSNLRASLDRVRQAAAVDTMAIQKYDIRRSDGTFEERHWSPINAPVFGADRRLEYIIHRVEDVTEFVQRKSPSSGNTAELRARVEQMEAEIFRNSQQVQAINHQLEAANKELESFSYSVSHDLRAPLRSIDGFSQVLLEDYADHLDEDGKDALQRVRKAATAMGELIDALLALSRVSRVELRADRVNLSALANSIAADLRQSQPDRQVEFVIAPQLVVEGDSALLRAMLSNLLGNAWKYTQPRATARIELGCLDRSGETVYFVRDNGVGFDMTYVSKLFGAFQRLHRQAEFSGTGIGLATVQRIVHRHGGRAWAEGEVDRGATFYFTLGGQSTRSMARSEKTEVPAAVS
jgi:PAS domain S-box-containing protein